MPAFGEMFKNHRINSRQTLRQFCLDHGFDPGNISKIERGRLGPPETDDRLAEYAAALGLQQGSPQWQEFFDTAAAERGRIPQDLLSDQELVAKLPVLFRTLHGTPIGNDSLDSLIEKIRKA